MAVPTVQDPLIPSKTQTTSRVTQAIDTIKRALHVGSSEYAEWLDLQHKVAFNSGNVANVKKEDEDDAFVTLWKDVYADMTGDDAFNVQMLTVLRKILKDSEKVKTACKKFKTVVGQCLSEDKKEKGMQVSPQKLAEYLFKDADVKKLLNGDTSVTVDSVVEKAKERIGKAYNPHLLPGSEKMMGVAVGELIFDTALAVFESLSVALFAQAFGLAGMSLFALWISVAVIVAAVDPAVAGMQAAWKSHTADDASLATTLEEAMKGIQQGWKASVEDPNTFHPLLEGIWISSLVITSWHLLFLAGAPQCLTRYAVMDALLYGQDALRNDNLSFGALRETGVSGVIGAVRGGVKDMLVSPNVTGYVGIAHDNIFTVFSVLLGKCLYQLWNPAKDPLLEPKVAA